MKKILSILLISLLVLTGCGGKDKAPKAEGTHVGLGVSIAESYDEEKAVYESNTTYATVVLEGDVIKYVNIDTAQNSFKVAETATDFAGKGTKKEQGKDYGMVAWGGSDLEWDEQIAEVEKFMVGKTIAEVEAGKGDADLNSKVSIYMDGYIATVKDAVANAVAVENADKLAVGSVTDLSAEKFQINSTIALVVTDADGKIVYATLDAAQTGAKVADGKASVGGITKTKMQLGKDYGMTKNPAAVAEWDAQAKGFAEFMVGQTVDAVLGMPTYVKDESHPKVPDVEDLKSTVTIDVSSFLEAIDHIKGNFVSVK